MDDQSEWRELSFQPAPPGWRLAYWSEDGSHWVEDMAGWVTMEQTYTVRGNLVPPNLRERRTYAADHEGLTVSSMEFGPSNVAGPFGPGATDQQIAEVVAARRAEAKSGKDGP